MIAQQTIPLETRVHRLEIQNRWFIGIAIVAVLAAVILGVWFANEQFGKTPEEQTVADLATAWTTNDGALLAEVYAPNAEVVGTVTGIQGIQSLAREMAAQQFKAEVVGPVTQIGNQVAAPIHLSWDGGEEDVLSVFTFNDDGLIQRHEDIPTQ